MKMFMLFQLVIAFPKINLKEIRDEDKYLFMYIEVYHVIFKSKHYNIQ